MFVASNLHRKLQVRSGAKMLFTRRKLQWLSQTPEFNLNKHSHLSLAEKHESGRYLERLCLVDNVRPPTSNGIEQSVVCVRCLADSGNRLSY